MKSTAVPPAAVIRRLAKPSEYIHIGGDECPKVRWAECPRCQARIRQLGLKAHGDISAEQELQPISSLYREKLDTLITSAKELIARYYTEYDDHDKEDFEITSVIN